MEFSLKHLYESFYDYKLFMEEQRVVSSDMFKHLIAKTNMTSEDLSSTKTSMEEKIKQLIDKIKMTSED